MHWPCGEVDQIPDGGVISCRPARTETRPAWIALITTRSGWGEALSTWRSSTPLQNAPIDVDAQNQSLDRDAIARLVAVALNAIVTRECK